MPIAAIRRQLLSILETLDHDVFGSVPYRLTFFACVERVFESILGLLCMMHVALSALFQSESAVLQQKDAPHAPRSSHIGTIMEDSVLKDSVHIMRPSCCQSRAVK